MHQDQGDASHVRAYAYAYGRLYIYGPLALEIGSSQANQEVTEPSKVTFRVHNAPDTLNLYMKVSVFSCQYLVGSSACEARWLKNFTRAPASPA
jgi:hypothetical protein